MLLIMVNDKKSQNEQSAQDTTREFCKWMSVPDGASERQAEENSSGNDVPPAFQRRVFGVLFCRQNQLLSATIAFFQNRQRTEGLFPCPSPCLLKMKNLGLSF